MEEEPSAVSPGLLATEAKHVLENFHAQQQLIARATDEEMALRKAELRRSVNHRDTHAPLLAFQIHH